MYGPSHWVVLAVFAAGAVAVVWVGRTQTERQARIFGRVVGAITAVIYAAAFVNALFPPDLRWSVPLHLTDLATMVTAYAMWSQRQWAYVLTYYWGLVLSVQALVSPVLTGPDFPNYQFLGFFAIHLLVVWAAIYLTWGRSMRPEWRSYRFAVAVTLTWVAVTMTFNSIAGSNYGFLNGKPETPSLLDVMGPWPWYVLVGVVLVAGVWALMTWPWEWLRRSAWGPSRSVDFTPTRTGKLGNMTTSEGLPVNHHADHPGFSGVTGAIVGLMLLWMGRANARLACEVTKVSRGDRVVDIGCGPGGAVREAARRGASVTGIDPAPVMLRLARTFTRDPGIAWAEGTAENVPLPDGSATVLWSLATVHHWQDVGLGLGQAHRLLAPNGRLLAVERRVQPGATGLASHGWTGQQAGSFAAQCRIAGFTDVAVGQHGDGRRAVWTVSAARP